MITVFDVALLVQQAAFRVPGFRARPPSPCGLRRTPRN